MLSTAQSVKHATKSSWSSSDIGFTSDGMVKPSEQRRFHDRMIEMMRDFHSMLFVLDTPGEYRPRSETHLRNSAMLMVELSC